MKYFLFIIGLCMLSSCATWYERTEAFQQSVTEGNFEQAGKLLHKNKKMARNKNKILFYLNLGYVEFMLGHPEESNQAFETAENLMDTQVRHPATQAAVLISNPEILPYKPEDFEVIMVNFYKAMNYLQLNDMSAALVEVRKINIKLNQLNDKYPEHKNRYQRDAFAHLLMGLIYDASGNYNDAFIAYRNAYEVYEADYVKNFGLRAPQQLKEDLLRTAYLCGFTSELRNYEAAFKIKYVPVAPSPEGQAVIFWLNGLGPVKTEWGLDFVKGTNREGAVVFRNDEYGLVFPFFWGMGYSEAERSSLANLEVLRVAFPKYVERPLFYTEGKAAYAGKTYPFELAEDINQIAFKTLHDRMLREFSTSLLRLGVKQSIKYAASKENKWLGFAVGLANAMTEKADTRNWQTLPYAVSYLRLPLQKEKNEIKLEFFSPQGKIVTAPILVEGGKGRIRFCVHSTL